MAAENNNWVKLVPGDKPDAAVDVPCAVAQQSVWLTTTMDEYGGVDAMKGQEIPLPDIGADELARMVSFWTKHVGYPEALRAVISDDEAAKAKTVATHEKFVERIEASPHHKWTKDFMEKLDVAQLVMLLNAANVCDAAYLIDVCCYEMAQRMMGRTPEELRKMLGIVNDFTPEEEEQVRRENEWIEPA